MAPSGVELWRSLGFVESRQPPNRCFYLPVHADGDESEWKLS